MRLYFLRHGDATWPNWKQGDDERPLTKKGERQAAAVGAGLAKLKARPGLVLTSPLPRAFRTAQLVAAELALKPTIVPDLAPGFTFEKLNSLLKQYPDQDLMLVGHEPSLSQLVQTLTGGAIQLSKAGLAVVELESAQPPRGALAWLIPPKIFKKLL